VRRPRPALRRVLPLVLLALLVVLGAGPASSAEVALPPTGTDLDYQLGGAGPVPDHVGIVVRDREAEPAGGYDVCYVNAFQTQPGERRFWRAREGLLLHDRGRLVVDEGWGEWLLDLRTAAKRERSAAIVGRWIAGCARDGFDAVELDNLDSFTRSHRLMDRADNLAFARLLVAAGHRAGLAVAQKNMAGLDGTRLGFDLAVAEECGRYDECGRYVASYGDAVLAVEYRRQDFRAACAAYGDRLPIVLRDRDVTPRGVHDWC